MTVDGAIVVPDGRSERREGKRGDRDVQKRRQLWYTELRVKMSAECDRGPVGDEACRKELQDELKGTLRHLGRPAKPHRPLPKITKTRRNTVRHSTLHSCSAC